MPFMVRFASRIISMNPSKANSRIDPGYYRAKIICSTATIAAFIMTIP